jgi:hypothetical protein
VRQAQEVEDLVIDRPGVGEEVTAVDHLQALAAEQPRQALQLLGLTPAGAVRVVLMAEGVVGWVAYDPLGL